jgi:hypothetical protein
MMTPSKVLYARRRRFAATVRPTNSAAAVLGVGTFRTKCAYVLLAESGKLEDACELCWTVSVYVPGVRTPLREFGSGPALKLNTVSVPRTRRMNARADSPVRTSSNGSAAEIENWAVSDVEQDAGKAFWFSAIVKASNTMALLRRSLAWDAVALAVEPSLVEDATSVHTPPALNETEGAPPAVAAVTWRFIEM